jgi:hypothetical protein
LLNKNVTKLDILNCVKNKILSQLGATLGEEEINFVQNKILSKWISELKYKKNKFLRCKENNRNTMLNLVVEGETKFH